MKMPGHHPSEQELLLSVEEELPAARLAEIQAHLVRCSICAERLDNMERTFGEVASAHRRKVDSRIPDVVEARTKLSVHLIRAAADQSSHSLWAIPRALTSHSVLAAAGMCLFLFVLSIATRHELSARRTSTTTATSIANAIPRKELTPGVTRPVTNEELCMLPDEGVNADVPPAVRREVFQEYGLANARAEDYEVDYLISPGLGGTESIANLWPQPYSTVWNARVKDRLESRLHQMVCKGQVPLATAQREIASDWISAYKKYFGNDRPPLPTGEIETSHSDPNS